MNNPIYQFNDTITVTTIDGQKIECITCLSNTNGPLHLEHDHLNEGEQLTLDEQALILAHAMGPDWRLDNGEFRQVDGKDTGVKQADLQAHHLTGAAYVYHYLAANDKLNNILLKNPNYRSWDREWGAPNPYEAMEQKDAGPTAPEHV